MAPDESQERKIALLDQMDKIPNFSGTNPYHPFNLFKKEFYEWAQFFKWTEEEKFFILKKKLEGKAAEIFHIQEENVKKDEELFDLLQDRLTPKTSSNEKLQSLWSFKQTPDMPVDDFVSLARKKARAAAEAHMCTSDKIEQATEEWLINALKANVLPQFRREILRKNPKDSKEFLEIAKLEEATWRETSNLNQNNTVECNAVISQNSSSPLLKLMEEMTEKMNVLTNKISELENKQNSKDHNVQNNVIVCRQCGRRGHGFIDCRLRIQNYVPNARGRYFDNRSNQFRGRGYFPRPNPRGAGNYFPNRGQEEENNQNQHDNRARDSNRGYSRGNSRPRGRGNPFNGSGRGNPLNE